MGAATGRERRRDTLVQADQQQLCATSATSPGTSPRKRIAQGETLVQVSPVPRGLATRVARAPDDFGPGGWSDVCDRCLADMVPGHGE